ncbi:MAG: hypothetical protein ICV52_13660 [Microcoleus sp. C1-bin4]|nr:hypothetical protein [Microcoleus sp. C1-bin4]
MSASVTEDFLRLVRSWLRIIAGSGNWTPIAIGAKFVISSREARFISSCDRSLPI